MPSLIRRRRLGGGSSYPNIAAHFASASSQFFSIASNSTLQMGVGVDMTLAGWVYEEALTNERFTACKSNPDGATLEYGVYKKSTNVFEFIVRDTGTTIRRCTSAVAISANTWYFVAAWYDGTNMNISVNNAGLVQFAMANDILSGTQRLTFSCNDGGATGGFMDGRLDGWGLWKAARGSGGALSTAQITALYNGGVGMAYRDLTASLKTGLVSWWNFDGNPNDSQGTNTLTDNGGVTYVAGKR